MRRVCARGQVCTAGESGCACEDNVCPAVERIMGLLSLEALWALLFLLVLTLGLLASVCIYMLCCRPAPRQVPAPACAVPTRLSLGPQVGGNPIGSRIGQLSTTRRVLCAAGACRARAIAGRAGTVARSAVHPVDGTLTR